MYYKYKKYIENSPNGTSLDVRGTEENKVTHLGSIDGWDYAHAEDVLELDERLQATAVELTENEKDLLRKQVYAIGQKAGTRHFIAKDIGDVHDLLADAFKLIEFNMMLTARLAGDWLETNPIEPVTKAVYAARNKAFLDAVDGGEITLRGDFDNMDLVMSRLLARTSRSNEIARDYYVTEMQRIGLL
jgi:hypothetical protein